MTYVDDITGLPAIGFPLIYPIVQSIDKYRYGNLSQPSNVLVAIYKRTAINVKAHEFSQNWSKLYLNLGESRICSRVY